MSDDNMSPPTPIYSITEQILLGIRDELRGIREELRAVNARVDHLTDRVDAGFARLDARIDATNDRLDSLSERVESGRSVQLVPIRSTCLCRPERITDAHVHDSSLARHGRTRDRRAGCGGHVQRCVA